MSANPISPTATHDPIGNARDADVQADRKHRDSQQDD